MTATTILLGNLRLVGEQCLAEPVNHVGSIIGAVIGWRQNEAARKRALDTLTAGGEK